MNLTCLHLCSIPNKFPPSILTVTWFVSFAVSIISIQFYYLQCSHPSHINTVNTHFLLSFVRVISKCSQGLTEPQLLRPQSVCPFSKMASHNLGADFNTQMSWFVANFLQFVSGFFPIMSRPESTIWIWNIRWCPDLRFLDVFAAKKRARLKKQHHVSYGPVGAFLIMSINSCMTSYFHTST